MKKIILSGINFHEGGPLSVYRDCLKVFSERYSKKYEILALVHKNELFEDIKNIKYIEFPKSRKNWLKRLYFEYIYFKKISNFYKPYLWLSMHDITPNVKAEKRAVYCHNPMPFYKMSFREMKLNHNLALFNIFYKYIYKFNINKNDYVIVQQNWLKKFFIKNYNLKTEKMIVSVPEIKEKIEMKKTKDNEVKDKKTFFYPTYPRVFKNIEIICEACKILENQNISDFKVYITIDGTENNYSKWLKSKYQNIRTVNFVGILSREKVFDYYKNLDCLIFPSKIETWGLPITEFKLTGKPIILPDLDYAHETIGNYKKTLFFNSNSAKDLSEKMKVIFNNKKNFIETKEVKAEGYFTKDWTSLIDILMND